MVELVRMIRPDGQTADVHPAEVENYRVGGYEVAEPVAEPAPAPPKRGRKVKGGK